MVTDEARALRSNWDGFGTTLWISAFYILKSLLGDQPSRTDTLPAVLDLRHGDHL